MMAEGPGGGARVCLSILTSNTLSRAIKSPKILQNNKKEVYRNHRRKSMVELLKEITKVEQAEFGETVPEPKWHPLKKIMLEARARGLSVSGSCAAAGLTPPTLYAWRQQDHRFAQAWADASNEAGDWYEDRLHDKAEKGDTTAIIVGLKMHGRFADNPAMLIQQDNRKLQVDLSGMPLEEIQELLRGLQETNRASEEQGTVTK